MKIEEAFGVIIKHHREKLSLSQEKLALESGLDRTYISLLERGKRKPTVNSIFSISSTLKMKPHLLIKEVELVLEKDKC
ncbi:helix-turn-helix domain-containing protein [Calidifontibacillus oryziterrae]|uniref:helix-turn-helix domain-containing protein n=1 Tax=Calidifontibacillus oryziterrae TaxID=1191699 RepID=UPI0002F574ED|nr:helix-turn-helix transcriptional regulator [Calidifontibacillus oryziterrae]